MQNYMKALSEKFDQPSEMQISLTKQVNDVHKQLSNRLEKSERKLLLQLADLEDALREEACLNSFVSGFRLACGIHKELSERPSYSFEEDEERSARAWFERGE